MEIEALQSAIERNKATPEYKAAFLEKFNAIGFEITHTLTEKELETVRRNFGNWWVDYKYDIELPIEQVDQIPAVLKQLREAHDKHKAKVKLSDKDGEIKSFFFERHYLPEEWDEVRELLDKYCVARQFHRLTHINEEDRKSFTEHTFKATGRKILVKFNKYHMTYKEIK